MFATGLGRDPQAIFAPGLDRVLLGWELDAIFTSTLGSPETVFTLGSRWDPEIIFAQRPEWTPWTFSNYDAQ